MLRKLLSHPLTRNINLDDPQTTWLRRQILREKPFLRKLYQDWYRAIVASLPSGTRPVLEIGTGAGFAREYVRNLITSDFLQAEEIDLRLSALNLPFEDAQFRAIIMTDALHHLPNVEHFFREASRCLVGGGAVIMIEPWVSTWSKLIYTRFHHEPFEMSRTEWAFPSNGPLSSANGALPWMIFERDRTRFEQKFPELKIQAIEPMMPFRYLLSGGVSLRSLMPGFTYGLWRSLENALPMKQWAMFAKIVLTRL